MKVRIVFEPRDVLDNHGDPVQPPTTELVFKGFFGEDGEPIPEELIDGEGWIADGDVEAFDMDVWSR